MHTALRSIQTFLLAAMGAYMTWLAASDGYWRLLNPKYAWLTFLGGVVLLFVGGGCFLNRERKPRFSELLSIGLFLGLALVAYLAPDPYSMGSATTAAPSEATSAKGPYAGGSLTLHFDDEATVMAEVEFEGESYTRLNLAELLAGEEGGWSAEGGRYALQGVVHRTPELDAAGFVSLRRLYVYCCLADAVEVTALVKVDDPETYRKGAWVHVLGVLEERRGVPAADQGESISSAGSERFMLDAVRVEEGQAEGIPFILDIKDKPPFQY